MTCRYTIVEHVVMASVTTAPLKENRFHSGDGVMNLCVYVINAMSKD